MSDLLASRVAEPDLQNLPEWQVAEILNEPDPALGLVPLAFSCRAIAEPAVLSGELALLQIVSKLGLIPADVSPNGQAVAVPTAHLVTINTLIHAVEADLRVDPLTPGAVSGVASMLDAIEAMGLLRSETKSAILAQTTRHPSWAEVNNVTVTAESVSAARRVNNNG